MYTLRLCYACAFICYVRDTRLASHVAILVQLVLGDMHKTFIVLYKVLSVYSSNR